MRSSIARGSVPASAAVVAVVIAPVDCMTRSHGPDLCTCVLDTARMSVQSQRRRRRPSSYHRRDVGLRATAHNDVGKYDSDYSGDGDDKDDGGGVGEEDGNGERDRDRDRDRAVLTRSRPRRTALVLR